MCVLPCFTPVFTASFVKLKLTSNCARDATIRVRLLFSRYSQKKQVVVILMTLALLPLALIPLELQRCLLDYAVANKDIDLLIWLAALYVGALLLSAGIKLAIRIQRVKISAQIMHTLRRSVFIVSIQSPLQDQSQRELLGCCRRGRNCCDIVQRSEKAGWFYGLCHLWLTVAGGYIGHRLWVHVLYRATGRCDCTLFAAVYCSPIFQSRLNRLAAKKAMKLRELGTFIVVLAED